MMDCFDPIVFGPGLKFSPYEFDFPIIDDFGLAKICVEPFSSMVSSTVSDFVD